MQKTMFTAVTALLLVLGACGESEAPPEQEAAAPPASPAPEEARDAQPVAGAERTDGEVDTMPEAPGPDAAVEPAAEPETTTGPATAEKAAQPVNGGEIYNTYCIVCHKAGLNAAPKFGNKILWGRVVKKGRETVYKNSINGIRGMPPRGGIAALSDEQVKAAVDYMVMASGGWREAE